MKTHGIYLTYILFLGSRCHGLRGSACFDALRHISSYLQAENGRITYSPSTNQIPLLPKTRKSAFMSITQLSIRLKIAAHCMLFL